MRQSRLWTGRRGPVRVDQRIVTSLGAKRALAYAFAQSVTALRHEVAPLRGLKRGDQRELEGMLGGTPSQHRRWTESEPKNHGPRQPCERITKSRTMLVWTEEGRRSSS